MKTLIVHTLVAVGIGFMLVPAQADTLGKIRDSKTITIAHREASLPFSYFDENKKPVGYSMDLCLKIADAVKRELKLKQLDVLFVPVTPSTRIGALVEGKADLECGSTTNNAERRKQVAFTIPHFMAASRMLVRADSGIKNWNDLKNKRVVTTKGTTSVKLISARDKGLSMAMQLLEANDHAESFAKVERKEADAFPIDDVLLFGLRAKAKKPGDFVIVGDPLSAEPYAIMLRRDDAPFKALVDKEMARIISDGELHKIYDKWFTKSIPPGGINMNMPMGHLLRDSLHFPTDKVAD
ncbi:MAG: hypothetical protein RL748_3554 [Pseudomonadota bacterium]|jgi:glutamate/aspartate transport system substrate-binding protein